LILPIRLFITTLEGLRDRSDGWRESAAVWAGRIERETDWLAERVYFHHELCDDRAGPLSLQLSEEGKFRLYRELAEFELRPIALIHTHPQGWVDLSEVDQRNQLSSRIGFWSLVVPWYGRGPWVIETIGVHTRAEEGWYRLQLDETSRRMIIED
jgi:proteasome lid subunit RPN8/RPN11